MKVLFICRSNIGLSRGGLQGQILRTAQGLGKRGVDVIFHDPWKNQIPDVDICHCWSSDPQMHYHVTAAQKAGVPVVISPVYMRFMEPLYRVRLEYILAGRIPGLFTPQKIQYRMFNACDALIALNPEEAGVIEKVFGLPPEKITIIPNGIDPRFCQGDARLFKERYNAGDFVLQVGYIEPRKNALATIRAMKGLPHTLVIVGGWEMRDEAYVEQCKSLAQGNVIFTGHIDYEDPLLAAAYKAAKVFVLPSFSEVMPLVVYEAAQAGCSLVLSNTYPCSDKIADQVYFADPNSPARLREQILKAMSAPPNKQLQETAMSMPTWQDISDRIHHLYTSLIQG